MARAHVAVTPSTLSQLLSLLGARPQDCANEGRFKSGSALCHPSFLCVTSDSPACHLHRSVFVFDDGRAMWCRLQVFISRALPFTLHDSPRRSQLYPARQFDIPTAEHEHEWHHRRPAAFASVFYVWAWFVCFTAPASKCYPVVFFTKCPSYISSTGRKLFLADDPAPQLSSPSIHLRILTQTLLAPSGHDVLPLVSTSASAQTCAPSIRALFCKIAHLLIRVVDTVGFVFVTPISAILGRFNSDISSLASPSLASLRHVFLLHLDQVLTFVLFFLELERVVFELAALAARASKEDPDSHAAICAIRNIRCIVFLDIPTGYRVELVTSELVLDPRFVCVERRFIEDGLGGVENNEDYPTLGEAFIGREELIAFVTFFRVRTPHGGNNYWRILARKRGSGDDPPTSIVDIAARLDRYRKSAGQRVHISVTIAISHVLTLGHIYDPFLPPELEHVVFELAALTHPKMIPILMVEPLLYRVVVVMSVLPFGDPEPVSYPVLSADRLLEIIRAKPPEFLQNSVQYLFLNTQINRNELRAVFTACSHVTNFVGYSCGSLQSLTFGLLPHLRRLTLALEDFLTCYTMEHTHSTLGRITHLELFSTWGNRNLARITRCLPFVPSLTHITLRSVVHDVPLQTALSAARNIHCIVFLEVLAGDRVKLVTNELALDPRFVCLDWGGALLEDWLHGVETGEDYWAFAEAFIAARQAGKVDLHCFEYGHLMDELIPCRSQAAAENMIHNDLCYDATVSRRPWPMAQTPVRLCNASPASLQTNFLAVLGNGGLLFESSAPAFQDQYPPAHSSRLHLCRNANAQRRIPYFSLMLRDQILCIPHVVLVVLAPP
ncbi:hypothetical protein C8R45DRAFT_1112695 [Mycena sanguinolenta]|nr:hypothetical protein C8R45DRAFT_1112695 [Mycena sanguinolenta]